MSTAHEIERAIRSLSVSEHEKLLDYIPGIFSELGGDAEWEHVIRNERPRPALTKLLDEHEAASRPIQKP